MSSVLDRSRIRDGIADDGWEPGEVSTAAPQRAMLVDRGTTVRQFRAPFLQGQLVIESERALPVWFQRVLVSLDELGGLQRNWDSYGAKRIRHSSILAAIEVLLCVMADHLPSPAVVPTNRGTVLFEWHTGGIDLEVEVFGYGRLHVAFADGRDGTEWEADIGSDFSRLVHCIEQLSERV